MCLLIVLSRISPDHRLVVAANRDELFDRPAEPMSVLRESSPRVLGGRDLLAGGTWLAVNELGVVAGLTNGRAPGGGGTTRRSRGELPLRLAAHATAELAVDALATGARPSDYNPSFMLVGDRDALFYVDMSAGEVPVIEALPPGIHILENRPLQASSPKVDNVRRLLAGVTDLSGAALQRRLRDVLANHEVPATEPAAAPGSAEPPPPPATAACVHGDRYGTRWSGIISVGALRGDPPTVSYADGAACAASFVDATPLWSGGTAATAD